jgi:hypothetical protein
MASTNLLQWNPSAANQENDTAYAADSQRAGGATNPSVFPSILANKLYYQLSTYMTALFTAFANKGFSTSDASLATLTAQCMNFLTTADVKPGITTVSYAASVTFDCNQAKGFQVTMNGNITSLTVTNAQAGDELTFVFIQDGSGGHTVSGIGGNVFGSGAPDTTPGKVSIQQFKVLQDLSIRASGPVTVS